MNEFLTKFLLNLVSMMNLIMKGKINRRAESFYSVYGAKKWYTLISIMNECITSHSFF